MNESVAMTAATNGEWQYCRAVSGFGWPQGYPSPCGPGDHPTHRRRNGSSQWELVEDADDE